MLRGRRLRAGEWLVPRSGLGGEWQMRHADSLYEATTLVFHHLACRPQPA